MERTGRAWASVIGTLVLLGATTTLAIQPASAGQQAEPIDYTAEKVATDGMVEVGEQVTFRMTVIHDSGPEADGPVAISDPNCGEVRFVGGDTDADGNFGPGETWTFECDAVPTEPGTFENTATFTVTDPLGNEVTKESTAAVQVVEADTGTDGGELPTDEEPVQELPATGVPLPILLAAAGTALAVGSAALVGGGRRARREPAHRA
jgi:hypothetical protein